MNRDTDILFAGDEMPWPSRPAKSTGLFREEGSKWRSDLLGPVESVARQHSFLGHAYGCEGPSLSKRGMRSSLAAELMANKSETPGHRFAARRMFVRW